MPTAREQLNDARLEIARLRQQIDELTKAKADPRHEAIAALEASGRWWTIAKGRVRPGEPLYAVMISEPQIRGGENKPLEGDDLLELVTRALAEPESWLERRPRRVFAHGR